MKYTNFSVLLALVSTSMANALDALTDTNFKTACDLWVSDNTQARTTYGNIKDW
ncbi:hypothetical protein TrRE_jg1338, partial [Triparma retinervis]